MNAERLLNREPEARNGIGVLDCARTKARELGIGYRGLGEGWITGRRNGVVEDWRQYGVCVSGGLQDAVKVSGTSSFECFPWPLHSDS